MKSCRRKPLQWWEPARLRRRWVLRELKHYRWAFLRWFAYGVIAAVFLHWIVVAHSLPLGMPLWLAYLKLGTGIPVCLLIVIGLLLIVPRGITIQPKHVAVQSGQTAFVVLFDRVQNYSISPLSSTQALAVLRVRYYDRRGKRRRALLGISRRIDLLQLDRTLATRVRLANWKRGATIRESHRSG